MDNFIYLRDRAAELRRDDEFLRLTIHTGELVHYKICLSDLETYAKLKPFWKATCDALGASLSMDVDTMSWRTSALERLKRVADAIHAFKWRDAVDDDKECVWLKPSPTAPRYAALFLDNDDDAAQDALTIALRFESLYQTLRVLKRKGGHVVIGHTESDDVTTLLQSEAVRSMTLRKKACLFHKCLVLIYAPS